MDKPPVRGRAAVARHHLARRPFGAVEQKRLVGGKRRVAPAAPTRMIARNRIDVPGEARKTLRRAPLPGLIAPCARRTRRWSRTSAKGPAAPRAWRRELKRVHTHSHSNPPSSRMVATSKPDAMGKGSTTFICFGDAPERAHPRQLGRHRQRAADVIRLARRAPSRTAPAVRPARRTSRSPTRRPGATPFGTRQGPTRRTRPGAATTAPACPPRPQRAKARYPSAPTHGAAAAGRAFLQARDPPRPWLRTAPNAAFLPVDRTAAHVANRFQDETKQSVSRFETNLNAFRYAGSTRRSKARNTPQGQCCYQRMRFNRSGAYRISTLKRVRQETQTY